jgi:cell division protein FtsB
MNRLTLTLAVVVLLACFTALGWALRWLWTRSARRDDGIAASRAALVARLHGVEVERDALRREVATLRDGQRFDATAATMADVTARLETAEAAAASAAAARDAALEEAGRWREAYEAIIREDRDDP